MFLFIILAHFFILSWGVFHDGHHTEDRITSVTVFLDNKSSYSFSYLQTSTGDDKILAAKHTYVIPTQSFGVTIQGIHTDNSFF